MFVQEADKANVLSFLSDLHTALSTTISNECTSEPTFTAPQIKDLLKIALHAARQTKRFGHVGDVWKSADWEDVKTKLEGSERFKSSGGLHAMVKQLVALGQGPQGKGEGKKGKKDKEKKSGKEKEKDGIVDDAPEIEAEVAGKKAKRKAEADAPGPEPAKKKKAKKSAKVDA